MLTKGSAGVYAGLMGLFDWRLLKLVTCQLSGTTEAVSTLMPPNSVWHTRIIVQTASVV